uniref:Uncharacterized protein n=1 Tax=Heterorhabditis bacteriophora TaxID=37862 RepID=A0A1I7WR86_HETBA
MLIVHPSSVWLGHSLMQCILYIYIYIYILT